MDKFSERLRTLRIRANMTQEEVGNRVNVTKESISQYEKGNRVPSTDVLYKLADLFDTSTDYLLGREKEEEKVLLEDMAYLTPEDLQNRFKLVIGDRDATVEEIQEMVEYIMARRLMKMAKRMMTPPSDKQDNKGVPR